MYKLIIGNVRVTILEDKINRNEATEAAKKAIMEANRHGKLLCHIEIDQDEQGLKIATTEKSGAKLLRKTLKQSMLDGMYAAIQEKLFPTNAFTPKDVWFDGDTGQEWRGNECSSVRDELLKKFEEWMKSV
ncbi:Hypothetical protein LUCI_2028 [Lucifera butyrica]|uniref:Uncharacterized protein n=1 Tax=Lucifera butyrica TaxID=1351585 RepID=A0A498R949_9FIRM|nr:hypothetical protein [Lucifera butyrica]VBB06792.1 Hypothetical protein LUCI_2028 [Lucifera butyrica]